MATDVKSELKELAGKVKASAFTTNMAGIPQGTPTVNQRAGKRAPPPTKPKPAVAQKPAVCPKKASSVTKRKSLTRQISGPKPPLPIRPPSVKKRTSRDETTENETARKISSTAKEGTSPCLKQSENPVTEVSNGDQCKDEEEKNFPPLSRTMSGPAVSFGRHIMEKPRSSSVHSDNDKEEASKGQHSPRPLPRPKTLKVASRSPEMPSPGPATPDSSRPTPPPRKKRSGELKRLQEGSRENSAEEQSDDSSNKSDNEQPPENNDVGYVNVSRTTSVSKKAPKEILSQPKLEDDLAIKPEAYDKSSEIISKTEDARMEVPVREERAESQDSIASYENIPDVINRASPEDETHAEQEVTESLVENDTQASTPRKVVPYENVPIIQKPEEAQKVTTPETTKRQTPHPYENIPSPFKAKPSSQASIEPAVLAMGQSLVDFSEHEANGFKENHENKVASHTNETVSQTKEAFSDDEPDYENTGEHARFNDPSAEMLSDPDSKFNVGFSMDFNRLRIDADDIVDPNDIYTAVPPRGTQLNQMNNDLVSSFSPTRQVDVIQESYYQSPSASPKPQARRNLFCAEASGHAGSPEQSQKRIRRPAPQPPVLDANFNVLRSKNKPSNTPPKIAKTPVIQEQPANLDDNIYVVPKAGAGEVDSVNSFQSSEADDFDDHIYKAPTLHPEVVPEDDRKGSGCSASSDFECFDPTKFTRVAEQEYSVPREVNAGLPGDEYMEPSRLPSFSQNVKAGLAKDRSESNVNATSSVELKPNAEYEQMVDPVTRSAIRKDGGDQNDSDDDYEKISNQSGQIDPKVRSDPVDEQPEYVDMSPVKETRPQSNVYLQPLKPPSPPHMMIGGVRPPPLPGVSRGRKIPPARPAPPAPDRIRSKTEVRPMLPPVKTLPSIPPAPVILDNSQKADSLDGHYERIQSLRREMGLPPTAEAESSSGSEFYDSEFDDDVELTGGSEKKRDSKEVDDVKPRSKLYNIANEILTTERTFVNALRLVCDEFAASVKQMTEKDPMLLPKGAYSQMFDDIKLIYDVDKKFLQELEDRMKEWDTHNRIGDIVKKYGYFLKMYTNYIKGYDRAMAVFQECVQKIPKFASLTKEYEKKPMFMNLKVSFYMLKPIQRIPSYRLLLIDYRKHLPEESEDYQDISNGLEIVSKVATHINESMKEGDKFQTMLKLQDRIINSKEIVKPGRFLLKEGVLSKLSRKDKQERMFFLLTDCLLYCENAPVSNQYKLRQELPLAGMSLDFRDNIDFIKELTIISTKRSFTVVASSQEERDEWVKAIQKAIDDVSRRMGTFQRNATPISPGPASPKADLGKTAPSWVPDARATMCSICCERFTRINRKHHCRACGEVVCKECSSYEAPLPYLDYDAVRVCEHCYDHLYEVMRLEEEALDEVDGAEHHPSAKVNRSKSSITSRFQNHSKKGRTRRRTTVPDIFVEVKAQEGEVSGYLKIIRKKKLKKRWFVLKGNVLYSFKAPSDPAANSTLPVLGYKVNVTGNFDAEDYSFQLEHIGQEPLVYKAKSREAVELWVNALEKASQLP